MAVASRERCNFSGKGLMKTVFFICPGPYLDGYHEADQLARLFNSGLKRHTPEGLRDRTMYGCHMSLQSPRESKLSRYATPEVQYLSLG